MQQRRQQQRQAGGFPLHQLARPWTPEQTYEHVRELLFALVVVQVAAWQDMLCNRHVAGVA